MKISILFIFLVLPVLSISQTIRAEVGVNNETTRRGGIDGVAWEEVKYKAATGRKFVFVECYATWCTPCKFMEQYIYTDKKVVKYLEDNFVVEKIQVDSATTDDEMIVARYQQAKDFVESYRPSVLPTFFIFSPGGELLDKWQGSFNTPSAFLDYLANCRTPAYQYYRLISDFKKGRLGLESYAGLIKRASGMGELQLATYIADSLIAKKEDALAQKDLEAAADGVGSVESKTFNYLLANRVKLNGMYGNRFADRLLHKIAYKFGKATFKVDQVPKPDWALLNQRISHIPDTIKQSIVYQLKLLNAEQFKDWAALGINGLGFVNLNIGFRSKTSLNNILWRVFEACDSKKILKYAVQTCQRILADSTEENGSYLFDTYANLLYKYGKVKEAIYWERRSIEQAKVDKKVAVDVKAFEETLNKMQKGLPTWPAEI